MNILMPLKYQLFKWKQGLLLILCFIFSWLLLTFKITEVPPGINGDEAHIAYNAMLVAKTGYDQNGKFLPIFISNAEQKDWKQPITFYLTVLGFKLFGLSYEVFKQINVVFALIGGFLMFLLVKEILGVKMGFVGLILYMTTPIIFIQSHLMLENIAPVPFVAFWLLMLLRYQKTKRIHFLFWAGLSLGFSIYSYLGMRLIVPVLVALSFLYIAFWERKIKRDLIVKASAVFILSLLPILVISMMIRNQYPGAILAENRPQTINSYQEFLLPYLSAYDFSFLFLTGDSTPYHSTGKHGIFLLASLPLFILGCYAAAIKRNHFLTFIVLVFFMIPILFGLTNSIHRGSRLLALVPPYIFIATLGLNKIPSLRVKVLKNLMIGFMIVMVVFNFYDFVTDYWFSYPKRVKSSFQSSAHLTFKILSQQSKKLGRTPVVQWDIYNKEGTTAEFFKQIYFPDNLTVKRIGEAIPPKSIFLISADQLADMEKRDFIKLDVLIPGYYFVMN